jgi:hypothetical protein
VPSRIIQFRSWSVRYEEKLLLLKKKEVADELGGGFSLVLGNENNVQAQPTGVCLSRGGAGR